MLKLFTTELYNLLLIKSIIELLHDDDNEFA